MQRSHLFRRNARPLAAALLVASAACPAGAALLAYEGFAYPAGQVMQGQGPGGGLGWTGPWGIINQAGGAVTTVVSSGSDVFAGNATHAAAATGNRAYTGRADRVGRYLNVGANGTFAAAGLVGADGLIGVPGTTVYASFTQRSNDAFADGFFEAELHRVDLGDGGRIVGVGDDIAGNNVNLRVRTSEAPIAYAFTQLRPRDLQTHLYVLRIDFGTASDTVRAYVDPTGTAEPIAANATVTNPDLSFDGFAVAAFVGEQSVYHDEIRFATTFAEAVGVVPEPATAGAVFGGAGALLTRRRNR